MSIPIDYRKLQADKDCSNWNDRHIQLEMACISQYGIPLLALMRVYERCMAIGLSWDVREKQIYFDNKEKANL